MCVYMHHIRMPTTSVSVIQEYWHEHVYMPHHIPIRAVGMYVYVHMRVHASARVRPVSRAGPLMYIYIYVCSLVMDRGQECSGATYICNAYGRLWIIRQ